MDKRAAAFARLFEAVHEGVYIGSIGPESSATIAANPHLKLIFGYASDAVDSALVRDPAGVAVAVLDLEGFRSGSLNAVIPVDRLQLPVLR